jgi:SagB-type dehydrogenase family enzyme
MTTPVSASVIKLPAPHLSSDFSLETALKKRRSLREFGRRPVSLDQVSQLAWAAQGISGQKPYKRTAPSAGGRCPLELYLLAGEVDGVLPGIYRYQAVDHSLTRLDDRDKRQALGHAAAEQTWLADAPVVFLFAAIYERTKSKYGQRGVRYVHMDVAFAAENLHLQAVALGLGTVVMGAFDDDAVHGVMGLPEEERPLLIMPVG